MSKIKGNDSAYSNSGGRMNEVGVLPSVGFTKEEVIAKDVMCALLSNNLFIANYRMTIDAIDTAAKLSVLASKSLIEQLNK